LEQGEKQMSSPNLRLTADERAALSAEMRRIGSLGGNARARNLSFEQRQRIAAALTGKSLGS
jgi:ABC-type thiamine transport system ATPase subunit